MPGRIRGVAFEDEGLQRIINEQWWKDLQTLGTSVLGAVEAHASDTKIADDLTVLALRRPIPLPEGLVPAVPAAQQA